MAVLMSLGARSLSGFLVSTLLCHPGRPNWLTYTAMETQPFAENEGVLQHSFLVIVKLNQM